MPESLQHPRQWSLSTWISAITLLMSTGVLGTAVWIGAEYGTLVTDVDNLDNRVSRLETRPIGPEAARRISVLEADQRGTVAAMNQLRDEQRSRLDRIEEKLDRVIEREFQ